MASCFLYPLYVFHFKILFGDYSGILLPETFSAFCGVVYSVSTQPFNPIDFSLIRKFVFNFLQRFDGKIRFAVFANSIIKRPFTKPILT